MKKYHLFDNEGKTFDRYTLIVNDAVYSLSHNAMSVQGVNTFSCMESELEYPISGAEREHPTFGVRVELEDLPLEIYEAVMCRILNED